MLKSAVKLIRIRQWTKNALVFAPLLFAHKLLDGQALVFSIKAFVSFCFLSSFIYVLNDYLDRKKDRLHPQKRFRPLAAKTISKTTALILGGVLLLMSLTISYFMVNTPFFLLEIVYLMMMTSYSLHLKDIVIIDVLLIALGFVLRAFGGALAISVPLSPWLLICAFLLSLFIALAKRKHEIHILGSQGSGHRRVLNSYNDRLLDQLISISSASVIVCYALYTVDQSMISKKIHGIEITLLFVIYGIFRYLYLIYSENKGGKPEEILLTDFPLLINIVLFSATVFTLLYFPGIFL